MPPQPLAKETMTYDRHSDVMPPETDDRVGIWPWRMIDATVYARPMGYSAPVVVNKMNVPVYKLHGIIP